MKKKKHFEMNLNFVFYIIRTREADCPEFSTLSLAVFIMSVIAWQIQTRPNLELKTQPLFA